MDQCLNGESCVTSIVHKANSRLKFLYRKAGFLNQRCRRTLCCSLIQCHLDYCISAWYYGVSQSCKRRLQVVQNKMYRYICGKEPRFHVGSKELQTIGLLTIEDRTKQLTLNHVHKVDSI